MNETLGVVGGVAIIGVIIGFWQQIKSFLQKIFSLMVVSAQVHGVLGFAVVAYLWKTAKKFPLGNRFYSSSTEFVRPKDRWMLVAGEILNKRTILFWKHGPIMVGNGESGDKSTRDTESSSCSLLFLRGTVKIDDLIIKAVKYFNTINGHWGDHELELSRQHRERFQIHYKMGCGSLYERRNGDKELHKSAGLLSSEPMVDDGSATFRRQTWLGSINLLGLNPNDIGWSQQNNSNTALEIMALNDDAQELIHEIEVWLDSEKWHRDHGVPWRRGWLLYGEAGTGKSTLVRALAYDYNMPVMSFDLSTMSNREFIDHWKDCLRNTPCICLIEDIDTIFHGRENTLKEMGGGLSFECFINCISGVEGADGVFLIVTTNDISKLDVALGVPQEQMKTNQFSTRPGRLDRSLEMGPLDINGLYKLAHRIVGDFPDEIESLVQQGDGDTGAQFQERCTQIALQRYWSDYTKNKSGENT